MRRSDDLRRLCGDQQKTHPNPFRCLRRGRAGQYQSEDHAVGFRASLDQLAETLFDLILIHRDNTDEEFVRRVKTTGANRLIHELGKFVWELNGYCGHDCKIVSNHTRFVECLDCIRNRAI